jgi:hypothetical protein
MTDLLTRLADVLRECADELEAALKAHYEHTMHYPRELQRYERDMEPVRRARALLEELDAKPTRPCDVPAGGDATSAGEHR